MSDKEKLLTSVIIVMLTAVVSYRITFVDSELKLLSDRIEKILETK